jgi:hypothetical protein
MTHANRKKLRISAAAVAAGTLAVAGTTLAASGASAAQIAPAHAASAAASHDTVLYLNLTPMPQGTVSEGQHGVTVSAFGLTPGSAHTVELFTFGGVRVLGTLTANGVGQASAVFPATARGLRSVAVLNAGAGTAPIAVTGPLSRGAQRELHAIDAGVVSPLRGHATVAYDPAARTITVTVTASGFTPGTHAAHIHAGSCQSQGPVQYMLPDFTADQFGFINHETRVVTGVTSFNAANWYLNLHLGNSNDILDAAGNPTVFFRPLLCANL